MSAFVDDARDLIGPDAGPVRTARVAPMDPAWRPAAVAEPAMPIDDVRACLSAVPNWGRDYDRWLRVGMAVHAATGGSIEGLAAWQDWGGGHDRKNLASRKWCDFSTNGVHSIGPGTLVHEARQHQPDLALTPREETKLRRAIAALKGGKSPTK